MGNEKTPDKKGTKCKVENTKITRDKIRSKF